MLKGGRYICTEFTYPEYFSKDDVQNVAADASMEAWFFCEYIARELDISVIFLGEEPSCRITQQYNRKMAEILPGFGIAVDIIPRISRDGRAISASTVRRLLQEGDFDAIARLVPPCTHSYLLKTRGGGDPRLSRAQAAAQSGSLCRRPADFTFSRGKGASGASVSRKRASSGKPSPAKMSSCRNRA